MAQVSLAVAEDRRADGQVNIAVSRHHSLDGLDALWRGLEPEVPGFSFFRSWSWVGCLVEERFPDPLVLKAMQGGRLVGLALFNRRGGRLCLGESGDAALDAPFVEHNGPLTLGTPDIGRALLQAAVDTRGIRRLILGGVPAEVLALAPGIALRRQERLAPRVDLEAVRAAGGDPLARLSANARQQIRRSARRYGGLALRRAETVPEALAVFAEMVELHGRSWRARGKPGAFASPFMRRFHEALIARAMPRGEVDLLRIEGDGCLVGILYNFRLGGRVSAYQSGFDLAGAGPHGKPGLTCHSLAIARAAEAGEAVYDFLGGADRYKLTLARESEALFWAEMLPARSIEGLGVRAMEFLRHLGLAARRRGSSSEGNGSGRA